MPAETVLVLGCLLHLMLQSLAPEQIRSDPIEKSYSLPIVYFHKIGDRKCMPQLVVLFQYQAPVVAVVALCLQELLLICSIHARKKISLKAICRFEINLQSQSERWASVFSAPGKRSTWTQLLTARTTTSGLVTANCLTQSPLTQAITLTHLT